MSERDADDLCTECGLCCDGTFFGSVLVATTERERLERVGLRIVDADGARSMAQPCSALRGCLCAVYRDRPTACVQYQCLLRKRVVAGEVPLADARTTVAHMRALLATIRKAFALPGTTSIWEAILALEEPEMFEGDDDAAYVYAAGIDAVAELLRLGRASFEPAFAGGGGR